MESLSFKWHHLLTSRTLSLPMSNSIDAKSYVIGDLKSGCIISAPIEQPTISRPSPEYDSTNLKTSVWPECTDSKISVLADLNSQCVGSSLELLFSSLPFQGHLLIPTLLTQRTLSQPKCNSTNLKNSAPKRAQQ